MNRSHWQDWIVALAGAWLVLTPYILRAGLPDPSRAAVVSFVLSGAALVALAVAAALQDAVWEDWTAAALGAWVAVSPWALGFAANAVLTWSTVVVGAGVVALAAWSANEGVSHA